MEHDADRFGELIEQRLVRRIEALERRQLQYALDLAFEDERQYQHGAWRPVAEAGSDPDIIGRQVVEHDLLFLNGALTDDALAQLDLLPKSLSTFGSVAGQQSHMD